MILYIPTKPLLINSFIPVCFWRKHSKRIDLYASPVLKGLKEKIRLYDFEQNQWIWIKKPRWTQIRNFCFSHVKNMFWNIHIFIYSSHSNCLKALAFQNAFEKSKYHEKKSFISTRWCLLDSDLTIFFLFCTSKHASIFNISKWAHIFSFLTRLVFFNIHVQIFFFSIYMIRVIVMISSYILFFLSISDNYWNLKMYPESDTNWYCHTVDNKPKLYDKWSFNFCFIFSKLFFIEEHIHRFDECTIKNWTQ
jgi:hypothetical protein